MTVGTRKWHKVALVLLSTAIAVVAFELALRFLFPVYDPASRLDFFVDAAGRVHGYPDSTARMAKNTGDYAVGGP